jgi:hypothetical protein
MLAAAAIVFAGPSCCSSSRVSVASARTSRWSAQTRKRLDSLVVAFGIVVPVVALTVLFYIADVGVLKATDARPRAKPR